MKYDAESHMTTLEDVKSFFSYLVHERHCNFHPDDDFAGYVYYADRRILFSAEEAAIFNRLMNESFGVCAQNRVSIYDLSFEAQKA